MKTITLADTADEYHGYDHVLGLDIDLAGDELAEVAPETAERLDEDHPGRFVVLTPRAAGKATKQRAERAQAELGDAPAPADEPAADDAA